MSAEEHPFIASCSFCGDGLLRFLQCKTCNHIVALCDECELMWSDIPAISDDANLSSDTCFPMCPYCGQEEAEFKWLKLDQLKDEKLDQFVDSESV